MAQDFEKESVLFHRKIIGGHSKKKESQNFVTEQRQCLSVWMQKPFDLMVQEEWSSMDPSMRRNGHGRMRCNEMWQWNCQATRKFCSNTYWNSSTPESCLPPNSVCSTSLGWWLQPSGHPCKTTHLWGQHRRTHCIPSSVPLHYPERGDCSRGGKVKDRCVV